jgi:hypothetical protein
MENIIKVHDGKMSYRQLLNILNSYPDNILDDYDVTFYLAQQDEFFPLDCFGIIEEDDVVDSDTLVFIINA